MIRKKVLIIDNSKDITGAYNSIITFSNCLKSEFDFHYAISSKRLSKEIKALGFNTHSVKFLEIQKNLSLILYLPLLLFNSFKLYRIITKHKIDIIHVNDLYNMTGVILKLFDSKIHVLYHVRLLPDSYIRKIYKLLSKLIIRFSDKVICVSKAVFNSLPDSSKKEVVYDPVIKANIKKNHDGEEPFVFLFPANFIYGKGQNYAIQAFCDEFKPTDKVKLYFAGSDMDLKSNITYKEELQEIVNKGNRNHQIEFLNFVKNMPSLYSKADVTLVFSESESFSMVTLESMIYGTPVIATKCGGPEELVNHNFNGILVNKGDLKEMREQMRNLYENINVLKELSNNAALIAKKYDSIKSAKELSDLYSNL